jgi:hypothetical protein
MAHDLAEFNALVEFGGEGSVAEYVARVVGERARLRAALVGIVGVDGREQLEQMEAVMRLMPAPAEDKAVTVDAIHALLATLSQGDAVAGKTEDVDQQGGH